MIMRRPKTLLDNVLFNRARQMLSGGTPRQAISLALGLGERTIRRIAAGEQQADARRKFERCPGCGGLQLMPCRVCPARAATEAAA